MITTVLDVAASDEPWLVIVATIGPLVAALAAIGALVVGIQTVRQRWVADSQAQWWARVQWAADLVLEPEESKRAVGFEALALLASSPLAGPDDAAFLAGLSFDALAAVQERGVADDVVFVPADDESFVRPSDARPVVEVTRAEVSAARLRVVADRGRARTTPAWIARLAASGA
ncbi:hypothetical protein ASD16_16635 [Cellulomonas sp. Root485]|uniref:hypothetical protein n=1 Tax=Cellulomonas sp. Root485 TaxID=1736546 RepID=UPI0006F3AE2E|nr:hypothetical protein [Cellulomonas sp. Root485]KQY22247.1 hypothetical protein ASD16_16635 [Cellulomonas sp. Root485]